MLTVKNWNQLSIVDGDEVGKLVISLQIEASNITRALDEAERLANRWNKEVGEEMQVNFITCRGRIRTC